MRLFVSGSAPLLAETHREWLAVGLPLPGVSVRITNPDIRQELARGEIGMIGPERLQVLLRTPEKTTSEFRPDGFFITGDLGKINDRGYVHIFGRSKDLVITGGFNVQPDGTHPNARAGPSQ